MHAIDLGWMQDTKLGPCRPQCSSELAVFQMLSAPPLYGVHSAGSRIPTTVPCVQPYERAVGYQLLWGSGVSPVLTERASDVCLGALGWSLI